MPTLSLLVLTEDVVKTTVATTKDDSVGIIKARISVWILFVSDGQCLSHIIINTIVYLGGNRYSKLKYHCYLFSCLPTIAWYHLGFNL